MQIKGLKIILLTNHLFYPLVDSTTLLWFLCNHSFITPPTVVGLHLSYTGAFPYGHFGEIF